MRHKFRKTVVVSLGGSIMYPEQIDYEFLRKFRHFIMRFAKKRRFISVAGGGRLSRLYQEAAAKITRVTDEDKDWLGIHATRSNAQLLRTIFYEIADPVVIDEHDKIRRPVYPVTIASGWRPGWSTDFIAIAIAEKLGVKEVIIAGKPSHVYPIRGREGPPHTSSLRGRQRASASNGAYDKHLDINRPYSQISWKKYRRLIPKKWSPGLHSPVDPVGAELAERRGIASLLINGNNLENFSRLLGGAAFEGTVIR